MVVSFIIAVPFRGAAPCGRPHPHYEQHSPDPTPPPGFLQGFFRDASRQPSRQHDSFAATPLHVLKRAQCGQALGPNRAQKILTCGDFLKFDDVERADLTDAATADKASRLRRTVETRRRRRPKPFLSSRSSTIRR